MPQIFHPRSNVLVRFGVPAILVFALFFFLAWMRADWSPWSSRVGVPVTQPVPFSHEHHVSGLGIDCRYCHTTVEVSSTAGMPETHTCMSCHSQVWTEAPVLAPVRESYESGRPIHWVRVYDLPDYVYFDHSIHVNKGVGCETCHGRVDRMPIMMKHQALYMSWCLDCHRRPEQFVRPREEVFTFGYERPEGVGARLVEAYGIRTEQLADCSICHR